MEEPQRVHGPLGQRDGGLEAWEELQNSPRAFTDDLAIGAVLVRSLEPQPVLFWQAACTAARSTAARGRRATGL